MLTASSENISSNKENKKTGVKKYLENMLMKINESCK